MNFDDYVSFIKSHEWKKGTSRELFPLLNSLVVQAYVDKFPPLGLRGLLIPWAHLTVCFSDKKRVDSYFLEENDDKPLEFVRGLDESFILGLLQETLRVKLLVVEKIEFLNNNFSSLSLEKLYSDIRGLFLEFFPLQILPWAFEAASGFNMSICPVNEKILIEWRSKTDLVQSDIEALLDKFISRMSSEVFDPTFFSDFELLKFFSGDLEASEIPVRERSESHVCFWNINASPPYHFFSDPSSVSLFKKELFKRLVNVKVDNGLTGKIISKGLVSGRVFVVRHKSDLNNAPEGCIIVSHVLEVDDLNLLKFKHIAGVVVEEGGVTSHVSIHGRELGVPILGNVRDAARVLKSGDRVVLDAVKGFVKILEE